MSTLRDDLLPTADSLRSLFGQFGVARYTATIRRRTWSGSAPGAGTASVADTPIVTASSNPPLVTFVTAREIASSGGTYREGDFRIGEITPAFVALGGAVTHTGIAAGTVTPSVAIPAGGVTHGSFPIVARMMLDGNVGAATFQLSTDGGVTWSSTQTTAASVTVPGIGVVLAFAGSFLAGEQYSFSAQCGGYTPGQLRLVTASGAEDLVYIVVGDEGSFVCTFVDGKFSDPVEYAVIVRRRRESP